MHLESKQKYKSHLIWPNIATLVGCPRQDTCSAQGLGSSLDNNFNAVMVGGLFVYP